MDNFVHDPTANFPWDKIATMNVDDFKQIPDETIQYVLDVANHDQVFKSALTSLKEKNPETTFEEAEKLVELMKTAAQKVLESRK